MKLLLVTFLLLPCLAFSQTPVFSVSATQTTICQGSTTQLSAIVNVNPNPQTTTALNHSDVSSPPPSYNCDCPAGYVAVGYQGRTGEALDQLTLACKKLNPDGSLASEVVYTRPAGGNLGGPKGPFVFTNNTALVGINLETTGYGYYDYAAISITGYGQPISSIAAGNSNTTARVALNSIKGTYRPQDAGTLFVPDGHVVTGIQVTNSRRGGAYVGSVSLRYVPIAALFPPSPYTITWSSAQTNSPITVSPDQTTSYTASATNASVTLPPASLTITVNSSPTVYTVMGGGSFCVDGSGVAVTLSNSQTGVNYQLQRDGNGVDSLVAGTGSPFNFGNQTTAGTYTVLAINPTTSCQQLMSGSATVSITPPPALSVSNNGPLSCAQTSVTLSASGTTGATYAFTGPSGSIASSGNTASVSDVGTYTVTASLNGCTSTTTTTVSSNTVAPKVSISPSATAICAGQSVTLNASTSGGTLNYRWNTNATSPSISVSATGPYSVTVTRSDNGCVATATASVTVNNPPTPSLTTQSGQTYPGNQSAVTMPQYSGAVVLEAKGCPVGSLQWTGPNGTTGTGNISVPTTNTGTFVYQLTCQVNGCTSTPTSATVIVQAGALMMLTPLYDCSTRLLTLRTTGGNGQPIEYQIPSVTTGWESSSTFTLQAKHLGKSLKLRARQRSNTSGGYVEVEISFTPTACGARQAAESVETLLQVVVLGNPVVGSAAQVEIRGAEGQAVNLRLIDLQGRAIHEQRIEQTGETQQVSLPLGSSRGTLLLKVSTADQQQSLKLLRP